MRWGGEVGLALGPARAAHFVSEEARKGQCLTRQVLLTHRSEMRLDGESAISLSLELDVVGFGCGMAELIETTDNVPTTKGSRD